MSLTKSPTSCILDPSSNGLAIHAISKSQVYSIPSEASQRQVVLAKREGKLSPSFSESAEDAACLSLKRALKPLDEKTLSEPYP